MTNWKIIVSLIVLFGMQIDPIHAANPALPVGYQCEDQLPLGQCWTTKDVIDGRIDYHAQSAMLRMFSQGGSQAADAAALLCAVKRNQLAGIYLPDQQVPALRAKAAGSGWWEIIPRGKNSECYNKPADRAPLIAFSKQIKDDKDSVASALGTAWKSCGIPGTVRCYTATISKPTEECETNDDCISAGSGNVCTDEKKCEYRFAPGEITSTPCSGKNQCDPAIPQTVWRSCRLSGECLKRPGERCGVCRVPGGKLDQCYADTEKGYRNRINRCNDQQLSETVECPVEISKCMVKRDPISCLNAAGCGVGTPHWNKVKCESDAFQWREQERRRCDSQ